MDPQVAELLGIDLDDPDVQRENRAIDRDMRLIESLVELRKAQGLTQAQVAERMGRSQPAVSDFERLGGDPHLSTIRRYALAVGASVHHIVRSGSTTAATTRSAPALVVSTSGPTGTTFAAGLEVLPRSVFAEPKVTA
ncbi:helix-turn-helix domain-containing protein [Streptosporangium sp. NPDC087985]|uniref:helix-turn-helix domain-containing protein n=1 Tax=Streptosporangium sp. NPDC087985 TaxID=3366196 RepID=UPI0038223A58